MPVPLSVTNPQGKGLAAQQLAELPTQGPFARLGASQDVRTNARPAAGGAEQPPAAATEQQQAGNISGSSSGGTAADVAVATHSLSFSYPDIGE